MPGHHIAIRDVDDSAGKTNISKINFITMPDQLKQITCMKLSPNKRFLVLAEQRKNETGCYLSIYDMKEPCYVVHKVHNISEMCEGRGNVYINGMS